MFDYFAPRDLSRLLVIPFSTPKIGAKTADECVNFQKLNKLKDKMSSCIGWAISLGMKLDETGVDEINEEMLPLVCPRLEGLDPRRGIPYFCTS